MKTGETEQIGLVPAAGGPPQPDLSRTNSIGEEEDIGPVPLYRKKRVIIPALLLMIAVAAVLWYWYTNLRGYNSTDDAFIDADRVAISSKILGRISQLMADEGDTIKAGEVIVRLDDSDLRAQEKQAKTSVVFAEENVSLAKVNVDRATDDFLRAERQYKDNIIPQEQFDHALKARDVAQAQYSIAVAQVGSAKAQLGVIETNLQNTTIVSPMTGVVSKRWALAGDVIQPAQPIFTVYNLSNVWVTANFEETKLSSIHTNDSVVIFVDSYPDRPFSGRVIQLGSNTASQFSLIPPSNASGNFTKVTQRIPIKISIDRSPDSSKSLPLLPGMSVEVKVRVK